jgi:uncharacterized protein (TIRG00374 family)
MTASSKRGAVGFWIGLAIVGGLLAWAVVSYDFVQVWQALKGANYWWILPAFLIEIAIIFIRAVRWRSFLEPIKEVGLYNAVMTTYIGFTGNMLLPARAGEFIRPWLLARRERIPVSSAMGTIVIERIVDGLTVIVVMVFTLFLLEVPEGKEAFWRTMRTTGVIFTAAFVTVFLAAALLQRRVGWMVRFINAVVDLLPERFREKVREMIHSFISGFDFLDNSRHIMAILWWSAVFWGVSGGLNVCFIHAFGLELPFIATYLILISQVIGVMAPTPGFVGPYHAMTIAALAFYGVPQEVGLSIAIVMHATMFVSNGAPGIYFLIREKLSFAQLSDVAEQGNEG